MPCFKHSAILNTYYYRTINFLMLIFKGIIYEDQTAVRPFELKNQIEKATSENIRVIILALGMAGHTDDLEYILGDDLTNLIIVEADMLAIVTSGFNQVTNRLCYGKLPALFRPFIMEISNRHANCQLSNANS